jgi:integrase
VATIIKRGDSWRAQIRKAGQKTLSATFTKKVLAEKWVRETEAAIETGQFQKEDPDFGTLVQKYIDEILTVKPMQRTHQATMRTLRRKVAGVKLSELNPSWMLKFAQDMDCAASTRAQYFIFLGLVLRTADTFWDVRPDWDGWKRGRAALLDYGLIGRSGQRDRRVTDEDIEAILDSMSSGLPMDDLIAFAVASCMRLSEITRAQWADVDHTKRTLLIRDRKHPNKKKGNHQIIPLLGEAYPIVKRQIRQHGLIFPFDGNSISAAFHRATVKAQIPDMRWHDLRHEGISRLFEQGYHIEQVAIVSGHQSWNMLKRYTHLAPESLHRDVMG